MFTQITSHEIAAQVWETISFEKRCDYIASNSKLAEEGCKFSVTMMMVAEKVMIVANCYGGGKPFCFSVTGMPKNREQFFVEFQAYLQKMGTHFWDAGFPYEAKRSHETQPMEIGLWEFAGILLMNSSMPMEIRFEKAEIDKDPHDPYMDEIFAFQFTDLADTIIGVCNSDSRHIPFCADVTNDECVGNFTTKFVNYLKGCGIRHSVRAFVNGSDN